MMMMMMMISYELSGVSCEWSTDRVVPPIWDRKQPFCSLLLGKH